MPDSIAIGRGVHGRDDFDGTPNAPALGTADLLDISNQTVTITKWLH
jgi:hypothetical protein